MAAQFSKRVSDAYIATDIKDYLWTTVSDKFIIYDVKDNDKYGVLDISKEKQITYYDNNGDISSYGLIKDFVYKATQSNKVLTLE